MQLFVLGVIPETKLKDGNLVLIFCLDEALITVLPTVDEKVVVSDIKC
jgi:hypothetical protein